MHIEVVRGPEGHQGCSRSAWLFPYTPTEWFFYIELLVLVASVGKRIESCPKVQRGIVCKVIVCRNGVGGGGDEVRCLFGRHGVYACMMSIIISFYNLIVCVGMQVIVAHRGQHGASHLQSIVGMHHVVWLKHRHALKNRMWGEDKNRM